ncbi:MAG: cupin [Cyanobacteria bacterium]|nr:cupin [Cyanobacteriota bacterium]
MAILSVPDSGVTLTEPASIQAFLAERGILFLQWPVSPELFQGETVESPLSETEILYLFQAQLTPYMQAHGYQTADVITVNPETPNLEALREKFLKEHTHSEDEVRFFVDGVGDFWFHLENEVFCVRCQQGDLISVPAGVKHWFEMGVHPFVKTIRIFTDASGWTPHYTGSDIASRYADLVLVS